MYWQDLGRPCQDILTIGGREVYYYNVRTIKNRFITNKVIYLPCTFIAETNDVQDTVKIKLHENSESMFAVVDTFSFNDRVVIRSYGSVNYESNFVINDGSGNALLYVSHDDALSVIKFNNTTADFIQNRIF